MGSPAARIDGLVAVIPTPPAGASPSSSSSSTSQLAEFLVFSTLTTQWDLCLVAGERWFHGHSDVPDMQDCESVVAAFHRREICFSLPRKLINSDWTHVILYIGIDSPIQVKMDPLPPKQALHFASRLAFQLAKRPPSPHGDTQLEAQLALSQRSLRNERQKYRRMLSSSQSQSRSSDTVRSTPALNVSLVNPNRVFRADPSENEQFAGDSSGGDDDNDQIP